jgi:glycerol-3-phosphate dehydrogenase
MTTAKPFTFRREEMLERLHLKPAFDVIIVGGGATGLGTAVESARRGHRTLLVEAADFAQGTSSRSTKLVHGGVRYLRSGQIKLVREALLERERLLRNAPEIVQPLRFVIPSFHPGGRWFYYLGLKAYDWLAGKTQLPGAELLNRSQCAELLPDMRDSGLRGGVAFSDGQFDDARLTIALARAAAAAGAVVLNYMPVTGLLSRNGRIVGIAARDAEQGSELEVEGRVVVNATGVFASKLWELEAEALATRHKDRPRITPSQGTHLVLPGRCWNSRHALLIPDTPDGRVLFVIPWQRHTLVGTTDVVVSDVVAEPQPSEAEIDYLLTNVGQYLTVKPSRADVSSIFAGLRPLVGHKGSTDKSSASLSREHELHVSPGKLISAVGGKWTTFRLMGEQLTNLAEQVAELPPRPSSTRDLQLCNALGAHAAFAFDDEAWENPSTVESMVRHAVQNEMARTVEDVLARRTRTLFLNARRALQLAPLVAQLLASELGRDQAWCEAQNRIFERLARRYLIPS